MFSRIKIGRVILNKELQRKLITTKIINGKIDKINIKFSKDSGDDTNLIVMTSDGEILINLQGNESGIYYPRNSNVLVQRYKGYPIVNESNTKLERFVSYGKLLVLFTGSHERDVIEKLNILVEGTITKEEIETDDDWTDIIFSGAMELINKRNSDKYNDMKKYITKVSNEIIKEEKLDVVKVDDDLDDFAKFIQDGLFDKSFKGLGKTTSDAMKKFLVRATVKGFGEDRIFKFLNRKGGKGFTRGEAQNIMRTEKQAVSNKIREWTYLKSDPEQKALYKWISVPDFRRTDVCENITERTKNGVKIDKLKEIIKEESIRGGFDGSREFTPHFSCRSTWGKVVV